MPYANACAAIFVCVAALCQAADESRPNVILVMTDDQGYGDIGAHGNTLLKTPNLDRLYAQSVRLTDFHVDPTCSPTRSALMTGRYSTRTGVWHTIAGRSLMNTSEVTLAEVFAANGYSTALFGKWHLGDNYPLRPQDQGFQKCLYLGGGGVTQTPDWWGNDYFDDTYRREDGTPEQCQGYCTDVWFDHALEFIDAHRARPFFCYLATNAPHGPYLVAEDDKHPYVEAGVPEPMASFYGMIANIDENIGRLVQRLDERKLADNTILIFMTDNGTAAGIGTGQRATGSGGWRGFNAGMRGQKGSAYEGGHRVPFYIRWPAGGISSGRDVTGLAAHIDVLPTLMELCSLNRPEGPPLDGTSLAAPLRGASEFPDRTLFVHSQRVERPEKWRNSSVMTNRWRLINGKELYDLPADPGQERDLAAEQPQVVADLRAEYEGWWESLTPVFHQYVAVALGADAADPVHLTCHDWHADDVPWSQSAVERDPKANGFWMVDVVRPGRYEFTLRMRPEQVLYPLPAEAARVRVGTAEGRQSIPSGATESRVVVELKMGTAPLQTWLDGADGTSRGAFFVDARRVGE